MFTLDGLTPPDAFQAAGAPTCQLRKGRRGGNAILGFPQIAIYLIPSFSWPSLEYAALGGCQKVQWSCSLSLHNDMRFCSRRGPQGDADRRSLLPPFSQFLHTSAFLGLFP